MKNIYQSLTLLFFIISFNGFSQVDTDGDGINDDVDNCPTVANGYSTEGTTVAGGNEFGSAANQLYWPRDIIIDASGNYYIADKGNNRIQKWAPGATEGTTVAGGNVDWGDAANQLYRPYGIALDASGNLYIADTENHRIQKWAPGASEGVTIAGGNNYGSAANQLRYPSRFTFDASGNLYIADASNHRIQKWAPGASEGTTVAGGNGYGSAADQLHYPGAIIMDASGNFYIADENNHRIQKWAPGATEGTTVAGGNAAGSAANQLNSPGAIIMDASGNLYIADILNNRIQKWALGASEGVTVAGGNSSGSAANQFNYPFGITLDTSGNLYIADQNNFRIQKWVLGQLDTDGDGIGEACDNCPDTPTGETVDNTGCSDSQNDPVASFVSTWAIEAGDFVFPLKDYADITIDWGDDSTSNHTDGEFPTHSYASSATFTIKVTVNDAGKDIGKMWMGAGASGEVAWTTHPSSTLIRTITNWGEGKWETFQWAYWGATGLTITATDEPDLFLVTDMEYAFYNCTSLVGTTLNDWNTTAVRAMKGVFSGATAFNGNISTWNTANVIRFDQMFENATAFNQNIGSWVTTSLVNTNSMFRNATSFNQDISSWDTSGVVWSMSGMFMGATSFNQDISSWNTSNVTNMNSMFSGATAFNQEIGIWDVSKVNSMQSMFGGATAFNQDISSWNTAAVTNMGGMFKDASAFNQALKHDGDKWNLANVTNMIDMFNGASLSIANYDVFLYSQAQNSGTNENITITVSSKYSDATSRNFLINSKSWIINDEGSSSSNNAPVVTDQTVTTIEDIPLNITLVGTDSDGDTLTYSIVVSTTNGTTILDGNKVTYTPKADYFGSDSFTFKANDGKLDSKEATVTINITSNDLDEDGVTDDMDQCPDTPNGEMVDANGCSDSQKDTDGDGVTDDVDTCPDTPNGEVVDANGCSDSQKDTDGDGVNDDVDQCPDTPNGEIVDADGCPLPLFVENISFVKKVYPNPTNNKFIVELKDNSKVTKVEFFDFSGKIITPNKVELNNSLIRINVSNLNNGIFILHITTDKEVNKVKVVIER